MSLLQKCGLLIFVFFLCSDLALSQTKESNTVNDSIIVLNEIMKIPAKGIPTSLFRKAEGIAIFPGMMKGGFIVGVQKGYGALVVKTQEGVWEYPRFAMLTSGSVGFQAGVQSADVILFLCSRRSVESMLSGKFTIGADANVAAGPVGRETSATTDINLTSEIYSYSRSRGVFLGVSIEGSAVEINNTAVSNYYRSGVPQEAQNLINTIIGYTKMPQ